MTEVAGLTDLIERLEKEGGSRELDAEVALATGWRPHLTKARAAKGFRYEQSSRHKGTFVLMHGYQPCGKEKHVPKYTTSLDAAIALCERVLPGWCWKVGTCHVSDDAWVCPDWNDPVHGERLKAELGEPEFETWKDVGFDVDLRPSGRVPVALCIATLKALRALEDGK
jgi:hypothetical protein